MMFGDFSSRAVCSAPSCSQSTPKTSLPDIKRSLLWVYNYADDTTIIGILGGNQQSWRMRHPPRVANRPLKNGIVPYLETKLRVPYWA